MAKKKAIATDDEFGISDTEVMGVKNQSIRDMNLTSEQKKGLIHNELEKILKTTEIQEGVKTTTSIPYPLEESGTIVVEALFHVDARISQRAWDYYKDNAEKPTVKEFVDEMTSIVGVKEYNRRVVRLNLN